MRVCIATPGPTALTETFIRAHIERLPFDIHTLCGFSDNCSGNGSNLSMLYRNAPAPLLNFGLNLLPRFAEFRLRRGLFPIPCDRELIPRWFKDQSINVVLAEYGPTGAALASACMQANVPLVVHFHGYDASRHDILEMHKQSYGEMFRMAAKVIVVSEQMFKKLVDIGCPAEKIVVSHYGPDPAFFRVQPDYCSNTILAVGRLTQKKAPHLTILAFEKVLKKFPEFRLMIIGEGELRGVCRDLIQANGLQGKVELLGAVGPAAVREHMAKSFLFVQHSVAADNGDSEGTPVAILEAGAAALPVVSTVHAGIPEVVLNSKTGMLVPERDIFGMAQEITAFATDRKRGEEFGCRARSHIAAHFTLEHHLNAISQVLTEVAGSTRR